MTNALRIAVPLLAVAGIALVLACNQFIARPNPVKLQESVANRSNAPSIPTRLLSILEKRDQFPPRSLLTNSQPGDEGILLDAFKSATNLNQRGSLVWGLAFVGGDASVEALRHMMTDEFAGRKLTGGEESSNEAGMLQDTLFAVGVMAARNQKAFELLKQGTDPWFWQKNVSWESRYGPDNYGIMAGRCIQGLGISGRKEVPEILEALSKRRLLNEPDPAPFKRTLCGEMVDAAFYFAVIRDEGRDALYGRLFTDSGDTLDPDGRRERWSATPEGKRWREWYAEFSKRATAEALEREKALKQ